MVCGLPVCELLFISSLASLGNVICDCDAAIVAEAIVGSLN